MEFYKECTVYLNDGTHEKLKNVRPYVDSECGVVVFYKSNNSVKAVYMKEAVSRIIIDDEQP